MVLEQFALLDPDPIDIAGIGLLKSPRLRDISPKNRDNFMYYSLAAKIIFSKNNELAELVQQCGDPIFETWSEADIQSAHKYDILTTSLPFVQLACNAFGIFFAGQLGFAPEVGFLFFKPEEKQFSGVINKDNYLMVEDLFKQLLHCEAKYDQKQGKCMDSKAKEFWDIWDEEDEQQSTTNSKDYDIGNIISKLCSCGIGLSMFNIYDLTIYQLYDQFSAYTQNRISQLSENVYAHLGGDNFDMNAWLRKN